MFLSPDRAPQTPPRRQNMRGLKAGLRRAPVATVGGSAFSNEHDFTTVDGRESEPRRRYYHLLLLGNEARVNSF